MWPFKQHVEPQVVHREQSSLISGINNDALLLLFLVAGVIGLWIYYSRLIFGIFDVLFLMIFIFE